MVAEIQSVDNAVELLQKLHTETALIRWQELQRFFAQGSVLLIANELDLVQVAAWFAEDNAAALEPCITNRQIAAPNNEQARHWYATDSELWGVVVAPFVLIQQQDCDAAEYDEASHE